MIKKQQQQQELNNIDDDEEVPVDDDLQVSNSTTTISTRNKPINNHSTNGNGNTENGKPKRKAKPDVSFQPKVPPKPSNQAHMKVEPLIRAMVALQCATMPQIVDYLVQTDPSLLVSFEGNMRKIQYSASGLMSHLRDSFSGYVSCFK